MKRPAHSHIRQSQRSTEAKRIVSCLASVFREGGRDGNGDFVLSLIQELAHGDMGGMGRGGLAFGIDRRRFRGGIRFSLRLVNDSEKLLVLAELQHSSA